MSRARADVARGRQAIACPVPVKFDRLDVWLGVERSDEYRYGRCVLVPVGYRVVRGWYLFVGVAGW